MSNWEWKKLGDVYPISMGKTPPRGDSSCWDKNRHTKNVWVTIADISSNENQIITESKEHISDKAAKSITLVSPNSLLLSFKLSIGKMAFAGIPLYTNEAIVNFPPTKDIDLQYLHKYFLYYNWDKASEGDTKVKGKTLNKEKLKNIDVLVPPLAEQKRIVKTLDEKFAKIDKLKTAAETNLKNARELFNAELEQLFNPSRCHSERSVSVVEESRNDLPKGWEWKTLNEVTTIRPPRNKIIEKLKSSDIVSFLPMEDLNIREREISTLKKKCLSEVQGSYTAFADGDVLLAKVTPCFENGKLGIANNLSNGVGFGSSEYIVFRCDNSLLNVYLFYVLMSPSFVDGGKKKMLGACGLKRLSKDYVENFQIPLPPLSEQKRIVAHLDILSEKVKHLEEIYRRTIADCEELKKSILKKTFEGES